MNILCLKKLELFSVCLLLLVTTLNKIVRMNTYYKLNVKIKYAFQNKEIKMFYFQIRGFFVLKK